MTSNTEKEKIKKYKYDKIYNVIKREKIINVDEVFKINECLYIIIF